MLNQVKYNYLWYIMLWYDKRKKKCFIDERKLNLIVLK